MWEEAEEDGPDWGANDELGFVFWCVEKRKEHKTPRRREGTKKGGEE